MKNSIVVFMIVLFACNKSVTEQTTLMEVTRQVHVSQANGVVTITATISKALSNDYHFRVITWHGSIELHHIVIIRAREIIKVQEFTAANGSLTRWEVAHQGD